MAVRGMIIGPIGPYLGMSATGPTGPSAQNVTRVYEWKIAAALQMLAFGQVDGDHHKLWAIDQAVQALTGDRYDEWVRDYCDGDDGPDTYSWDIGTAP